LANLTRVFMPIDYRLGLSKNFKQMGRNALSFLCNALYFS